MGTEEDFNILDYVLNYYSETIFNLIAQKFKRKWVSILVTAVAIGNELPRNEDMRKKWLEAIPKDLIRESASNIYICGVHFTPESFQPASLGLTKNMLRRTAIPSIFDDVVGQNTNTKSPSIDTGVVNLVRTSGDTSKVNVVNASDVCVYVITNTEGVVVNPETSSIPVATPETQNLKSTCDVGIQVSLPTDRERELQRKLYSLQRRLERREARIYSIMADFKTLMDQS